jgi:hypothetical protein
LFFEFLDGAGVAWREAGVDDVSRFVAWLRAPDPDVMGETVGCQPATVNQILAGVFGCYDYLARLGVTLSEGLVAWRRAGRRSYTPFLYHATKANPIKVRPLRLAVPRRAAKTLTVEQIVAILAACDHLRDRFLFALMAETGVGRSSLGVAPRRYRLGVPTALYRAPGRQRQWRPGQDPRYRDHPLVSRPAAPLRRVHAGRVRGNGLCVSSLRHRGVVVVDVLERTQRP